MGQLRVLENAEGLARAAATLIAQHISVVLGAGGARFGLALSGGRTPLSTYEMLAAAVGADQWRKVEIYLGDERPAGAAGGPRGAEGRDRRGEGRGGVARVQERDRSCEWPGPPGPRARMADARGGPELAPRPPARLSARPATPSPSPGAARWP